MAGAAFAVGLAPGDAVRRRTGLPHRLLERGGHLVLELPDKQVTLPVATGAAVTTLLGGGVHTVGNLPGMDEADQLVLVRRLLREGVLLPTTAA